MDWKSVAQLVAPFAPTVGRFLGDLVPFPGASIVGGLLGDAVAAALGVPATPEAVGSAIQNMPPGEVAARLQAAESEAVARYDAMARIAEAEAKDRTAQSTVINESVRAEAAQGVPWWHWRHLIGYLVLGYGLEQIVLIAYVFFGKGYGSDQLTQMFNATTPFTVGLFALLGYVAQDSTNTRIAAITGQKPDGIIVGTAKALGAKKK